MEITISGKLTSHRARYKKFREGYVAKCGEPAFLYVDKAVAHAVLKKGIIGVSIFIMQPTNYLLPNEIEITTTPEELEELEPNYKNKGV